jgi:hypothetical protein
MQHAPRLRRAGPVALVLLLGSGLAGFASADPPDALQPPECTQPKPIDKKEQTFCCDSVNSMGKGSGEGCVTITEDHVDSCSDVLACAEGYTKTDGHVTCTE